MKDKCKCSGSAWIFVASKILASQVFHIPSVIEGLMVM